MDVTPTMKKVVELVKKANEGEVCLPDFQRDFVWPREAVADLVRSILRGYYIGSLLLLGCNPTDPPFQLVTLRGSKQQQDLQPHWLVLDGQQRLTALLYALYAPNTPLKDSSQRRYFFVDLKLLIDNPEDSNIVFDRSEKELDGIDQKDKQYDQYILPCTRLTDLSNFMTWSHGLESWLQQNKPAEYQEFINKWRDAWMNSVVTFQGFQVPVVQLPQVSPSDNDAMGRICAVFEKLNSTGVLLSVYDLLTARLYPSGIKLHSLWNKTSQQHSLIHTWSKGKAETNSFGVMVLRTLALMRGVDPTPRVLINLNPTNFEKDWRKATAAIEKALKLLTFVGGDGFGVFEQKWLPGFGLLPVLAALYSRIDESDITDKTLAHTELKRWYWCSVFLERYSSAVESKSRKDYQELVAHWLDHTKPEPALFAEAQSRIGADGYQVRDSLSYASAVYSGIFCLLALRQARDWSQGQSIALQTLQDHHIFPQAYLKRKGISNKTAVNTIVNRTLISESTNGMIKDKAPATYLASTTIFPIPDVSSLLEPHFIDTNALTAMQLAEETTDNTDLAKIHDEFLAAREAAIVAEIRRVCGVVSSSVLKTQLATTTS